VFNIAVADPRRGEEEEDAASQPATRKSSEGSDKYARKILGSGHRCPSESPYEASTKEGDPTKDGQSRASESGHHGKRYEEEVDEITKTPDCLGTLRGYARRIQKRCSSVFTALSRDRTAGQAR